MTKDNTSGLTLTEFERLLDVFGGDRTRWPAEARSPAAQIVARDARARRLLAESEALDRALERAPLPPLSRESPLAERIVAAARRSPRIVGTAEAWGAEAVPARASVGVLAARGGALLRGLPARRRISPAAGLLAASLAIGISIGLSRLGPAVVELTGFSFGHSNSLMTAQIDPFDEDLL